MRRILGLLSLVALLLSVAGCGASADAPNKMTTEEKKKTGEEKAKEAAQGMKGAMERKGAARQGQ